MAIVPLHPLVNIELALQNRAVRAARRRGVYRLAVARTCDQSVAAICITGAIGLERESIAKPREELKESSTAEPTRRAYERVALGVFEFARGDHD